MHIEAEAFFKVPNIFNSALIKVKTRGPQVISRNFREQEAIFKKKKSEHDILEKGKTVETVKRSVVSRVREEGEMNRGSTEDF